MDGRGKERAHRQAQIHKIKSQRCCSTEDTKITEQTIYKLKDVSKRSTQKSINLPSHAMYFPHLNTVCNRGELLDFNSEQEPAALQVGHDEDAHDE